MTACVINYQGGNLGSVLRAMRAVNAPVLVAESPSDLEKASHVVLPGVGHFADTMDQLIAGSWVEPLRRRVLSNQCVFLGICVGMQVLAQASTESLDPTGRSAGLGLVSGLVQRLDRLGSGERVPQQGWNSLSLKQSSRLLEGLSEGTDVYFSNSFALPADASDAVVATTDYGASIAVALEQGNIAGIQFHPEKSSRAGLRVLRNFLQMTC